MSIKKDKIHNDLVKGLNSSDDQVVLNAMDKIKSVGTSRIIPELLQIWFKSSGEVKQRAMEILYSVKDKDAAQVLFDELEKAKNSSEREKILSIFWNAGLEPKNHLSYLVKLSIDGEFMEAMECLTIIESMEPPLPEDQLMDCLLMLKDYFAKNPTGEKVTLIRSIATYVQYTEDTQVDL